MSKSKYKIGDRVKDLDGDKATIIAIYERDEAPNQILVNYDNGLPIFTDMLYETDLEKID